ncbi:hypothetical protein OAO25_00970 [Flavobacteriaceae bacterium]|nr:hypothetical protein [Flavobacteriaceae bacterium]
MTNDVSLKKRYFAKLSTNIVGLLFGLITFALIPRGLGPVAYGDFSFLTVFFLQLIPFITFSTSIGFFTKLAQRQEEFGLVSFFGRIIIIGFTILFVFIFVIQLFDLTIFIWPDQQFKFIVMAFFYTLLTFAVDFLTQISDARGITVSTEIAKLFQKFLGFLLVLGLFYSEYLNLTNFFYYHFLILLLLIIVLVIILKQSGFSIFQSWHLDTLQMKKYFQEFYDYSKPLFLYSLITVLVGLLDRWLLQKYGGSVQQGFFAFAFKVGAICFLFSGAMTSIITREFAISFKKKDLAGMRSLFRRYIPLIYSITAFISCFVAVQAKEIILIIGGEEFSGALMPMIIIAFYPIHQTYGQLSSSVFYASGETKTYSTIGFFLKLSSLPILYFTLAPPELMGLNMGATGLAIKFILLQFIGVNVYLYYNSKFLNLNFIKYFMHQLICIGALITLSILAKLVIGEIEIIRLNNILFILISGILYFIFSFFLMLISPKIFGLYKSDIYKCIIFIKHRVKTYSKKTHY